LKDIAYCVFVPREAISRVSAYDWLGSLLFMPLGFALAGPVSNVIGIDSTLWAAAGLLLAANAAIIAVPSVRGLRSSTPEAELREMEVEGVEQVYSGV
jgi:hypothetical protein